MRRRAVGVGSVVSVLVAGLLTTVTTTDASWREAEWAHGPTVGTLDCDDPGIYKTRGNGRLLSGGLLGLDLDSIATVRGMRVTNSASAATPTPSGATAGGSQSWRNPLDVGVLSAIQLPLSPTYLDDLLEIPLNTEVGALNQWGRAGSDGTSGGAAGVVNNSGVVMTADEFPGGQPPDLGTLRLSRLVTAATGQAVGNLVAGLTDLSLEIGAVAGRASLDACEAAFGSTTSLNRQYAVAGLDADVDTPLVGNLVTTVNGTVSATQGLVNGLAGNAGVLSGITTGVTSLLSGVLGALRLGSISPPILSATVDFSAVNALLTDPIDDANGVFAIDLDDGVVRLDLAALLGEAYGGTGFAGTGDGLNGLDPNTELVLNAAVINGLTGAITAALDQWVADVLAAVRQALYLAKVDLDLTITLQAVLVVLPVNIATVQVKLDDASLGSLLGRPGFPTTLATVNASLLPGVLGSCNPVFPSSLACTIGSLLNGVVGVLTTGVGPLVGGLLDGVLLGPTSPVATLGASLQSVTAPLVTLVGQVLNVYLGVNGVASLRANVQNDAGTPTYPDWEGSAPQAVPDGRYDVAALGVVVLGLTGTSPNINLELARGSVGVNCNLGGSADRAGRCAGY